MQNNQLEMYLGELEKGLRSLPPLERERELTEARQHLELLIAARRASGVDTQTATNDAIRQFGSAQENGTRLRQAAARGRLKNLPPLAVAALYSLAASTCAWYCLTLAVGLVVVSVHSMKDFWMPQYTLNTASNVPAVMMVIPSHILGMAALAFLFVHKGVCRSIHDAFSRKTAAGVAVLYIVTLHTLGIILITPVLVNFHILALCNSLWMNIIAFVSVSVAGWFTGLRSEISITETVKIVAIIAILDLLTGFFNLLGNIPPFALSHVTYAMPSFTAYSCVPIIIIATYTGVRMRHQDKKTAIG